MNKVSVVIPIYNVENYLRKCLDSVCNQTYENLEIICVNDCSPDNSSEILKEYAAKDNRIKIINHKKTADFLLPAIPVWITLQGNTYISSIQTIG